MSNRTGSTRRTGPFVHGLAVALLVSCGAAVSASAQTTVTLGAPGTEITADLTIQGGDASIVDFSTSPVLASKVSSESYTRRILFKFDTQNLIPANVVIQSAKLHLVLTSAETTEARPLTAFHVSQSFTAGQTNWLYYKDGLPWSTPGGDFGARFSTTFIGNAVGSTYTFDLTSLVQQTVNGAFGSRDTRVALVDTGAATAGNYREFHSTRASDATLRPRLVITYGAPGTASTAMTLRVMQWNIHKTKGSDGACNPDRVADTIVAQDAHVVSINEVNFFSGTCAWTFDMGEKLHSLVQQKSGLTWYRQHVNAGGVGNVLLSRYQPSSSTGQLLSYGRGVAQMTIVVNGQAVNVFSTHVDYANASWRTLQIGEAIQWMSGFGEPRIVMGDFNTWPGTSDYNLMATPFQDAWTAAQSSGTATSYNGTGATHGTSRFDYVFYSRVAPLVLQSVTVPNTVVNGVYPSDHDPVIAVFALPRGVAPRAPGGVRILQ